MTIIEVLFAIVILSGVMLALSRFGQGFQRATRNAANLAVASDLATARLEVVRAHPDYASLVATFNGTTETSASTDANPPMFGYDGFSRETKVSATSTDSTEFVTVTVTVTAPVLTRPMRKSLVIGAF